jgi:hypothetical protein
MRSFERAEIILVSRTTIEREGNYIISRAVNHPLYIQGNILSSTNLAMIEYISHDLLLLTRTDGYVHFPRYQLLLFHLRETEECEWSDFTDFPRQALKRFFFPSQPFFLSLSLGCHC